MRLYPVLCLLTLVLVATACGSTEPGPAPSATPAAVTTAATVPNVIPTGISAATATSPAPDKSTVTLNTLEGYLHGSGWASDVSRAYFSKRVYAAFKLIRYNSADDTWTTYTAPSSDYCMASDLCITGGKVYVVHQGPTATSAYLSVFNTSDETPALVGIVHEYPGGGPSYGGGETIVTDGTYLYIGTTGGRIKLVALSDLTTVLSTLTLSTSGSVHSMEYNPSDGKVYAALSSGAAIYQISRSGTTLSESGKCVPTLPTGGTLSDDLAVDSTDLWLPIERILTGQIVRVPLTLFNDPPTGSQTLLTLGPPAYCFGCFNDSDGEHLWLVWGSTPGQLTRLKKSDLSTERIWLESGENNTNEVVQYASNKYLVSTFGSPAKIIKLTNPFPDIALEKPASDSNYSYWVPLRVYVETTPEDGLSSPRY